MKKVFFVMAIVFVPALFISELLHAPALITFFLSAIAIVPLASYLGESTEVLASKMGPALGGFMNATFGNAAELMIGYFALREGLVEVVKASVAGSILGNILLVLGLSMLVGGLKNRNGEQQFNTTSAGASATLLWVSAAALAMIATFAFVDAGNSVPVIEEFSEEIGWVFLFIYVGYLVFSLFTHDHLNGSGDNTEKHDHHWSTKKAAGILVAAAVLTALVSEAMVKSIEPAIHVLGWSEVFVGVIFVAIIGNAAEHFSAITVAAKNQMDLSLQIAIGSAVQIAFFVLPVFIIGAHLMGIHMDLIFDLRMLMSIFVAAITAKFIVVDGKSNWFEGLVLLGVYAILGFMYFHM